MKSKKGKIEYGPKDLLTAEDYSFASHKARVSMWMDVEIIDGLKILAMQQNSKYQTLANSLLRAAVEAELGNGTKKKRA